MASNHEENRSWSEGDVPDQSGRVVVITGANTGIGYEAAAVLAHRGAHVVLAVRNLDKGNAALSRIVAAGGHGAREVDVTLQQLDLTSLDAVRSAADALRAAYPRIDLLINNAGVMWTPKEVTADGFELQFGTNHLGHFALTGLLLDHLLPVRDSRVVTISSVGHRLRAAIHFDDLQWERRYDRIAAYGQSKLANLLFVRELSARGIRAYASDPGATDTDITRSTGMGEHRGMRKLLHTPAQGARASLQAVTTDLPSGTYLAPRFNQFGPPKVTKVRPKASDPVMARRLWELSAELTGCDWPG
jgi:NAD(P)-dependent dehydrogenase (short-subunit alcohol dehydrogenase family)